MYDTQFMGQSVYCSVWPTVREEQMLIITLYLGKAVEKGFLLDLCHSCVREGGTGYCCLLFVHSWFNAKNDK